MDAPERFARLAAELAAHDPELPARLDDVRAGAERLRAHAVVCVDAFCAAARGAGAVHLTDVQVSPLRPDEKHLDCLEFSVRRGRYALIVVSIARATDAKTRLVGPFRVGRAEGPCADAPLAGAEVEAALADRIEALLREAAGA